MGRIPLLDIRAFQSHPQLFVEELRRACHCTGFFLLRHHLSSGLPRQQLEETARFFRRHSPEQKQQISYERSPSFRGYMRLGVENTAGVTDAREQVELVAEYDEGGEGDTNDAHCPPYERLKGRNQWPSSFQPTLQTVTERYIVEILDLARQLRQALCLSLGLERNAADPYFSDQEHWGMKLVSYPACTAVDAATEKDSTCDNRFGVGSHTDTNFLTLILQDGETGLQVFTGGEWVDVPETGPDCLICNLGEQAEILSGGYLLATPHRVLLPKRPRTSVPFFYNPALSSKVQPLVDLRDDNRSSHLLWERESDVESLHWRMPNSRMLTSVGENTFKSLARSHPAVFARHHPDLEQLPETGQVVYRQRNITDSS